jgi:hypothetical protein
MKHMLSVDEKIDQGRNIHEEEGPALLTFK